MNYQQLTERRRYQISALLEQGISVPEIIGIKKELLKRGGQLEIDSICATILYRHLTQKQRVDAMVLIRSLSNPILKSKLITKALDATYLNPQWGIWSMTNDELQADKDFHEFIDSFASYIGLSASGLGVKELIDSARSNQKLAKGGIVMLVIWGTVAFNKSELNKVSKEINNRTVMLTSELY
ncbi:hypothetical protein ACRRS0_09750 [Agarivorans sp. QJM3NY_29]|uniref:hypothetical protein n=1 Tax=unclassified Agarivorans TaxID=2636026 RepID=UPI003D7E2B16